MTYLFVITFFVAIFTLDEKRIEQRRNAFIPCIIHSEERSKICFQKNLMHTFLKYVYSNFILTKVGKVCNMAFPSKLVFNEYFFFKDNCVNVCDMHDWIKY